MMKLKICFLGNHTVGIRALRVLRREADLVAVVAHPDDPEDGVRYLSVFDEARRMGVPSIRATGKCPELAQLIAAAQPDLIWITDYRYLIPGSVLTMAKLGAVNLHPSLLPKYRGRAPLNWAILKGESRLGLTAHFVDEGADTGDIISQCAFSLFPHQDVGDALNLLYPLYEAMTTEVLAAFTARAVARHPQNGKLASVFPRRTPEDGLIDWSETAREVWNLIRAVAAPYPGAFSPWSEGVLRVWKAEAITAFPSSRRPKPGEILSVNADESKVVVACLDAAIVLSKYELEQTVSPLVAGTRLGSSCEPVLAGGGR
ncbi:MAG: formyltransferase family protein [Opitutaceae bacterium]